MRRGRIGSGRIQVDRERERVNDGREYRERRFERHDGQNAFDHDRERYQRNRGFDRDDWVSSCLFVFFLQDLFFNTRHNLF